MNAHKKYIKNIYKQYGKNIKAFEDVILEAKIPEYTEKLYEKHGLNLSDKKPMVSVLHKRWGFPSREKNTIESFDDIERIANE